MSPPWLHKLRTAPLKTRRLVIRPLRRGDDRAIYPAVAESMTELARWLPWATREYDAKTCRAFVRGALRDYAAGRDFPLAIFTRDGHFVGGTGFHLRGPRDAPYYEIGYWCRSALAGNGYITEAAGALLRCAFRAREVYRVEIRCDPRNRASARVIRKLGLRQEGHLRKTFRDGKGGMRDQLVFARVR